MRFIFYFLKFLSIVYQVWTCSAYHVWSCSCLITNARLIIWFFKKYISKLPLARPHSDWIERPEASKESIGLSGRSTFWETKIPKRRLPLYLTVNFYQPNILKKSFMTLKSLFDFWYLSFLKYISSKKKCLASFKFNFENFTFWNHTLSF